jgi:hypothetical protein
VNDAFFSQLVDHRGYFRQFFTSFLLYLDIPQIPDRITGGFTIVTITIPALGGLPYIFFGCLMICHVLDIFRTAKVCPSNKNSKFEKLKIIKSAKFTLAGRYQPVNFYSIPVEILRISLSQLIRSGIRLFRQPISPQGIPLYPPFLSNTVKNQINAKISQNRSNP